MKAIFLGGLFDEEMEVQIFENSLGSVQYAANNLQKNILNGFLDNNFKDIEIYSIPFIDNYPNGYKNKKIPSLTNKTWKGLPLHVVGFNNLWGYRNISRSKGLKKALIKNVKKVDIIFVYSLHTPLVNAAVELKKIFKNAKICLIAPDLPQYMSQDGEKRPLYSVLKTIDSQLLANHLKKIDYFVSLTRGINDAINLNNKPFTILEGIAPQKKATDERFNLGHKFNVLYTGTLNERYGVMELIEAVMSLNNADITLHICGKGNSEGTINELSLSNEQIIFYGQVTTDQAKIMQRSADLLVNPRRSEGEYTKFSFPSKTLEYLSSGTPSLVYKLDGIPEEYDNYLLYVETFNNNLAEAIQVLSNKEITELDMIGNKGMEFVNKFKTPKVMSSKILELVN